MLERLWVQSFLLISQLEMQWSKGLHVITGETGSGKSMLLDAVACLAGQRADAKWVRQGCDYAEVGAVFSPPFSEELCEWLLEQGFDIDEGLWLRRTVDAQGKSKAWINQKPMPLGALKRCMGELIELAHQHMHIQWLKPEVQRVWFDSHDTIQPLLKQVMVAWQHWQSAEKELDALQSGMAQRELEREVVLRRRQDLEVLRPTEEAWEEMNRLHERVSGAADRIDRVDGVRRALYDNKDAILDQLHHLVQRLSPISHQGEAIKGALELLEQAQISLQEVVQLLRHSEEGESDVDLDELDTRIAAWHRMARRYNVADSELYALWLDTLRQWEKLEASADIDVFKQKRDKAQAEYFRCANILSEARRQAVYEVEQKVLPWLPRLNLPDARFSIGLTALRQVGLYGQEEVTMIFQSHPSLEMVPLAEGASGGELARIALILALLENTHKIAPVRFFDEVDTGISGSTVAEVGRLLQQHAIGGQIICITHQPQMAACADTHWRVEKNKLDMPVTQVSTLSEGDRCKEIARLMAASSQDELSAEHHARQLRQNLARKMPVSENN